MHLTTQIKRVEVEVEVEVEIRLVQDDKCPGYHSQSIW